MLTTQLLDTAPPNEVPARLSTFDYLTTSDTDADNADLPAPAAGHGTARTRAPQILDGLALQVEFLVASV
jgi:hypothetical protein